jgi:hypothetical protein
MPRRFYVTESVKVAAEALESIRNCRLLKEHPMRELPCKYDHKLPTRERNPIEEEREQA